MKKTDHDIGKHGTSMQSTLIVKNQELTAERTTRTNGVAAGNNVSSKTRQDNTAIEID